MPMYLTSGELIAKFLALDTANVTMTSGDIKLKIPESGATLDFKKTSGSLKTDLPYEKKDGKYVFGEGGSNVSVKITSGSLKIE